MKSVHDLNDAQVSDVVQMALSDHVAFADIEHQYGLKEKDVVALMRNTGFAHFLRTKAVKTCEDIENTRGH